MKKLLTAREMKNCDEMTMEHFHMTSAVLMERAALSVVSFMEQENLLGKRIGIICGTGNNGGDGIAIARLLFLKGQDVSFFVAGTKEHFTKETRHQYDIATTYGVCEKNTLEELLTADIYLDALLGIGLSRELTGDLLSLVQMVNQQKKPVIGVDIPTGISADSGIVMGDAIQCESTVTFGFQKLGQVLFPGAAYCGDIIVSDIGITDESLKDSNSCCVSMDREDIQLTPPRDRAGNKGSFGKVLVIAGNEDMAGAAIFATKAAYRVGCGMVKVFTHQCNRTAILSAVPEAILTTYDRLDEDRLLKDMQWANVILIGPGIGDGTTAKQMVSFVLKNAAVPLVLDADALNIIAADTRQLLKPHTEMIVTPHLGEMSRLRRESILFIKDHLIDVAQEFAREYNVVCVLKDARTITSIPYSRTFVNQSGNDGMATAGSGDVLSGMIAGLMAQHMVGDVAAPLGVYLHGLAGDLAAKELSTYGVMAQDILDEIPNVMKKEV